MLAVPALNMKTGVSASTRSPTASRPSRGSRARAQFSAGGVSPVQVVVDGGRDVAGRPDRLTPLKQELATDPAFGPVSPSAGRRPRAGHRAASRRRRRPLALATCATARSSCRAASRQATVYVGGKTAGNLDFIDIVNSYIPCVFAFVLGLSFLLLMVAFRSIVVPLMAILMNLLSVGAAYGLVALVFQHGWGAASSASSRCPRSSRGCRCSVLHPLRPVDGLPRLPAQPHPGALGPHRRQREAVAVGLARRPASSPAPR